MKKTPKKIKIPASKNVAPWRTPEDLAEASAMLSRARVKGMSEQGIREQVIQNGFDPEKKYQPRTRKPKAVPGSVEKPRVYLSEAHKRSSERAMEAIAAQPRRSAKEAYDEYDRIHKRGKYAEPKKLSVKSPTPKRKYKKDPFKATEDSIQKLLIAARKASDSLRRQSPATLEEMKEQGRRTGHSPKDSISPKTKSKRKPVESQNDSLNDAPEIRKLTPREEEAISRMFLESQSESLEETHRQLIAAGRKPDWNRYAR